MQRGFLIFAGGFAGGIAFRSFFDFGSAFAGFFLLLGIAVAALFLWKKSAVFLLAGLCVFAAGAGMIRFELSENTENAHALDAYAGRTTALRGIIADEPDVRESHIKLTIAVTSVGVLGNEAPLETKIRLIAQHYPEFSYGDAVRIRGVPQKPSSVLQDGNGTGRTFRYAAYLAKDDIFYEMFYPAIERIDSGGGAAFDGGGGNPIKRALFSLKRAYLQNLAKALPEPHAALAGGITVGSKESLGDELLEAFRRSGIIHIVVLSGYNITIVAESIGRILAFAPRMFGLGVSATSIILFALMTGAGATVVRASLMALLVLLARATGRASEMTAALAAAAFFMLLANPRILAFDSSFQLSFLATAGLLNAAPHAARLFKWLPAQFGLREAASATVATQLFVLPLLVYLMGEFSLVSFAVNMLILPFVPITMFFSFLAGAAGFLFPLASLPFSFAAWGLLEYALGVTKLFAALPFASFSFTMPFSFVLVAYALFGAAVFTLKKRAEIAHRNNGLTRENKKP